MDTIFIDTLVIECQNLTDFLSSTGSKHSVDAATTVTNCNDFLIAGSICLTVAFIVSIIAYVFRQWCKVKQDARSKLTEKEQAMQEIQRDQVKLEAQRKYAEREQWIALKKDYQKMALEHINAKEGTSDNDQYLEYIDKYIHQIDEFLNNISSK